MLRGLAVPDIWCVAQHRLSLQLELVAAVALEADPFLPQANRADNDVVEERAVDVARAPLQRLVLRVRVLSQEHGPAQAQQARR